MLRVYSSFSPRYSYSPPERKSRRYPRSRATLLPLQCAARLCVLKSSSGPSGWQGGLGKPGQPKSSSAAGEKIKVATRTAHPSPLGRRVNATLCTPHGSPTLMSAQDDATGAGDRLFNDLQTARLPSSPSSANKSLVRVTSQEREKERKNNVPDIYAAKITLMPTVIQLLLRSRKVSLVNF